MTVLARFDVTGTLGIAKATLAPLLSNAIELRAGILWKHCSMDQETCGLRVDVQITIFSFYVLELATPPAD